MFRRSAATSPLLRTRQPLRLSGFGRWVLRACESVDLVLAGRRLWLWGGATGFAGAVLALNRLFDNETLAKVSTLSGIAVLYLAWLMTFAFAGNLRDCREALDSVRRRILESDG